jgi:hypothetical protein
MELLHFSASTWLVHRQCDTNVRFSSVLTWLKYDDYFQSRLLTRIHTGFSV